MSDYNDLELQEQLMNQLEEMQTEIDQLKTEVQKKDLLLSQALDKAEEMSQQLANFSKAQENNSELLIQQQISKIKELTQNAQTLQSLNSKQEKQIEQLLELTKEEQNLKTQSKKINQELSQAKSELDKLQREIKREKEKPPKIEYRDREVVKIEQKCRACNQDSYKSKKYALESVTYGALAYSVLITIMSIFKNDVVKSDLKAFLGQVRDFLINVFKNANKGFLGLSNKVDNVILHWIIFVVLWLVVVAIIGFGIYKLNDYMTYKTWKYWNIVSVGALLFVFALVVVLGEQIKILIHINLIWLALALYGAFIIGRVVIYYIKKNQR